MDKETSKAWFGVACLFIVIAAFVAMVIDWHAHVAPASPSLTIRVDSTFTESYKNSHPLESSLSQRNARVTEVHDETSGNLTGTIVAVPNMGGSLSYSYAPVRRGDLHRNYPPSVF